MVKKPVQRDRSKQRGEAYPELYVEPLSDARTKLEGFFNILLVTQFFAQRCPHKPAEQRMWPMRTGTILRMKLRSQEPGMIL